MAISPYYDESHIKSRIESGEHRAAVGGLWEQMGAHQLEFLKQHGLQSQHRLLDIGCGAFRFGVHALAYLEAEHYFGTDISADLVEAGYAKELSTELRAKLPRQNLIISADFDFSALPARMNVAMAQSVFSHLPLTHLRRCLHKLAAHMEPESAFYATFFICPDHHPVTQPLTHPIAAGAGGAVTSYDYQDPYHYTQNDLEYAAKDSGWRVQVMGDWGHPRGQQMVVFIRQS